MKPIFSDREYQEILRGRARLEKIKVKDYGYPVEPLESEPVFEKIHFRTYLSLDKKALELQERIVSLEEKFKTLGVGYKQPSIKRYRDE